MFSCILTLVQRNAYQPPFKTGQLLRKRAYSNILKISPPKTESFRIKNLTFFRISAQNHLWF